MIGVNFHIHGRLNNLLAKQKRFNQIAVKINGHETVKHIIESLRIPHTEVDVVLVNGISVDFTHRIDYGDRVDVFPDATELKEINLIRLKPSIPEEPRFVVDGHLGKLASLLRLLGFDTLYQSDFEDEELSELSFGETRILLTRDRGLLMRK